MTWIDVDGLIHKRSRRMLRVIEHKYNGQCVGQSQHQALLLVARCIHTAAEHGIVDPQSGVFVLRWNPDDLWSEIRQVGVDGEKRKLGESGLRQFICCED